MKKIIVLMLVLCICGSLAACGDSQGASSTINNVTEENRTSASDTENGSTVENNTQEADEGDNTNATEVGSNILVVYFSNTGNTRAIAESIANGLDADIYEIIAEDPYTEEDLDYGDNDSRSTTEMNDSSVRPAISGSVENMEQYDTIYIGYPIWWGEAPRILDTFVESYDFADKTVIPFCTSASSGMGSSGRILEDLAGSGNWLSGRRFSGNESAETVMEWVNSL